MINAIGYKHWAIKARATKIWRGNVVTLTKGRRPKKPLERAFLRLTRHSEREGDIDNIAISFKSCVDGLKEANIILDDKTSVVFSREYCWKKAARGKGFITIEVLDEESYAQTFKAQK